MSAVMSLVCGVCMPLALAASTKPPTVSRSTDKSDQPTLKPVDPGVSDVGPLSGPGRVLPADLRQPANFDRVYEVEIDGKPYFVRAHGGVYAVFPRSDYVQTRAGVAPIVPAGTVFHLGSLPKKSASKPEPDGSETLPALAKPARPMRLDQTAPGLAAPNAESAQPPPVPATRAKPAQRQETQPPLSDAAPPLRTPEPPRDSIWQSEFFRAARTSELLDQARAASSRRTGNTKAPAANATAASAPTTQDPDR
jgi:hypothetical protein